MKLSNAAFLLGTVLGLPAFFLDVKSLPLVAQVGWAISLLCFLNFGIECWIFEHTDRYDDNRPE